MDAESKIGHITSFFDLEAEDIDEKPVKFDQFRGKVTVITNVASYCGELFKCMHQIDLDKCCAMRVLQC